MQIRKIESRDLTQGFRETLESLRSVGNLSDEQLILLLKTIERNPGHMIFVAVEDDKVVGTATLLIEQKFIREGGQVGHIEDVAVRMGWQGQQIGKKLVEHLIGVAKKCSCYKIILDCAENAAPFYEKTGFRQHEIQMRLDLR